MSDTNNKAIWKVLVDLQRQLELIQSSLRELESYALSKSDVMEILDTRKNEF